MMNLEPIKSNTMKKITHALHLLNKDILDIVIENPSEITMGKPFPNFHLAAATALAIGKHFAIVCGRKVTVNSYYKSKTGLKKLQSAYSSMNHYKGKPSQVIDK